ncbi:zinc ribbon domain-containing protein [Clostridium lundense]|uniref:zinc ribbon domain-containing protein n=1 Tax=Clostridium lundense TaxID=319475 RepID=UPI0004849B6B|nr:zinc ribbon domain-containing protein [Clostridium lundense]
MSFSSRSSNGKHYRNGHYGSRHYQKKGFLGKLFDIITSRSCSHGHYNNYGNQYNNEPMYNQPVMNQNTIICRRCNSKIPAGSKFCLQCGEKVSDVLFCMNCGEKLPPNAKFCLKCGNRISK